MSNNHRRNTMGRGLPRLCGADVELGNFIRGIERPNGTGCEASHDLLAEIDGYPKRRSSYLGFWPLPVKAGSDSLNLQDVGRRYLAGNGGCAYIDLNHLELAMPEVLSAYDHVAAWHAMLRIARGALDRANAARDERHHIQVLVNNSDGLGSSYGSHLNFLIGRRTFDNIFSRKMHYLQFLASFQVSAILLTGQGKAGAENGRRNVPYQISQRADFFEVLQGIQTTFNRPIVNSRDEALCGRPLPNDPNAPARLHVIFFDSALAHGSALFRVGPMQLILTLIEKDLVNSRLILEDPLAAVLAYSHDRTLHAHARLIHRQRMTALELQSAYLEEVKKYAARGVFDGIVPRAGEIIALWEDTLVKLAKRDFMALASRLDWIAKLAAIERAMEQHRGLEWNSPEVKVIDHMYSNLGRDGIYWAYEAAGLTEQLVSEEQIARFVEEPPADTRAWTRAMLLRRAAEEGVGAYLVDWDSMMFRLPGARGWPIYRTIELNDPLAFTRNDAQQAFDSSSDFVELLGALEAAPKDQKPALHAAAD